MLALDRTRFFKFAYEHRRQFGGRQVQAAGVEIAVNADPLDIGRQVGQQHALLVEQTERQQHLQRVPRDARVVSFKCRSPPERPLDRRAHIGKDVAKLLQPFGVKLLACDKVDISDFCRQYDVESVSADELWARSDVLTIHLPKNSGTIGLYTPQVLAKLKPGMVLINCARGGLVDEAALAVSLKSGAISAAAFDVFAVEPANTNPLIHQPNMFASPHIGATTLESWRAMLRSGMDGVMKPWEPKLGVYPFD